MALNNLQWLICHKTKQTKPNHPQKCPCGNQSSIKHILIECTKLNHTWKKFYKANCMNKLFFKNCSQKQNQLLKNNWPLIRYRWCYQHVRSSSLYKQQVLTFIYTHICISKFNTQWPLRGQFAITPNHHLPENLHLQIIYKCKKALVLNNI